MTRKNSIGRGIRGAVAAGAVLAAFGAAAPACLSRPIEPVEPRNCLRGFPMLARGKGAPGNSVDEYLNARSCVRGGESHVIGRAFVAESRRNGPVHRESIAAEGKTQLCQGRRPFVAAMGHGPEVGDGQMTFAVGGIGRWGHGRRIGCPHRRAHQSPPACAGNAR